MPGQVKGGGSSGRTAEEGTNCCRTAGAREDLAMGKSSGRRTEEERGCVQSDCRKLLQQALRKHWNTGQWSHFALKG